MQRRFAFCLLGTYAGAIGAIAGCARSKAASADTAAAAAQAGTPSTAASPATQSLSQLAGTWKGITLAQDRDTTLQTWTFTGSGDTGTVTTSDGVKTAVYDAHVVGDSILGTLGAENIPGSKGKPVLATGRFAVQVRGDSAYGTGVFRPVAKPATVLTTVRTRAARVKP